MQNTSQRNGMATPLVVAIILVVAALAGAIVYGPGRDNSEVTPTPHDAMMEEGEAMEKDGDAMMEEGDTMMKDDDAMMESSDGSFSASGTVLAGTTSPLIDFNSTDYERALSESRTVLLYFYANWCPICRVEFQDTEAAFRELNEPSVVGFRVNYNDSETDDNEESLARQFGIAYQHTKVILHGGAPVLKDGSTWDRDRYIKEITDVLK